MDARTNATPPTNHRLPKVRVDLQLIADMITPASRVLDVGCGDGTLLDYLAHFKQVDGRGIEIRQAEVTKAVTHGLSVIQGDAETDLRIYPSGAFDFVVLSQTLQAVRHPLVMLQQLLRVGRRVIVSFPNFGHWRVRWQLLWRGRMPVTESLEHRWFDTPNIHLCTIRDFIDMCRELGITIEQSLAVSHAGRVRQFRSIGFANLFGEQGVFLLSREERL
jgi:methionine biosynthesis protein MetW